MIKVVMFDLDGTLLPMHQETFVKAYFGGLAKKMQPFGYDMNEVVEAVRYGVGSMIKNDGSKTNEEVFWDAFAKLLGEGIRERVPDFDDFYKNEFQKLKDVCGFDQRAKDVVELVKNKGFRVVLATSPMFPKIATESRIRWAGFEPSDFELVTTYEDYSFAKPSLGYYEAVLDKLGVLPSECVMIGNDALEDMVAKELGIKVFLLTDCLINRKERDLSEFEKGSYPELIEFINNL